MPITPVQVSSKVSIIIPTYNRAGMIGEMIRSIYRQRYADIEIIVVDDGSSDQTREVIDSLMKSDEKPAMMELRYIHKENGGAPSARNEGIRQATGSFLMFADSDDEIGEDGIEAGMRILTEQDVDFVYMRVVEVNTRDGAKSTRLKGSHHDGSDRELLGHHWHTMGAIYTKELVRLVGEWNEFLPCSQDWEFQVRVKLSGANGKFVDTPMGIWNIHKGPRLGVSGYNPKYVAGVLMACDSIRDHCARAKRLSAEVKSRLCRRLIRHALEAGSHGDGDLRGRILGNCNGLISSRSDGLLLSLLQSLRMRSTDQLFYRLLCRVRS